MNPCLYDPHNPELKVDDANTEWATPEMVAAQVVVAQETVDCGLVGYYTPELAVRMRKAGEVYEQVEAEGGHHLTPDEFHALLE